MPTRPPLAGMRVVESSVLGPAEMGGLLADLGADVIKVEPPQGDYGRQMTWPIVKSSTGEGDNSLLSLHINRGKRSIAIDLRKSEGVEIYVDLAQADAAAYVDWYRIESWRAYERPEDEVYGNKSDNYERRAPGTAGMKEGVRYQVYATADGGHVLFMASEQAFWKNFCEGVGRMDLFERWPGSKFADHARNNVELQGILTEIFKQKAADEWIEFGGEHNTPIAPA